MANTETTKTEDKLRTLYMTTDDEVHKTREEAVAYQKELDFAAWVEKTFIQSSCGYDSFKTCEFMEMLQGKNGKGELRREQFYNFIKELGWG